MAELTKSEKLFEQACKATGIACRRVRTANTPGNRRPDYKVRLPRCGAFIEIKEITPNEQDRQRKAALNAGEMFLSIDVPGARLRGGLREASDQLKRTSRLGAPTAVAFFDMAHGFAYTDPYHVMTAMFGLEAVVIAVPRHHSAQPYTVGMKSGGKATLTDEHNTSISAVIVMCAPSPNEAAAPLLFVYHNHYARIPCEPEALRGFVAAQYRLAQLDDGKKTWVEI